MFILGSKSKPREQQARNKEARIPLAACLTYSSDLKMDTVGYTLKLVNFCQATWHHWFSKLKFLQICNLACYMSYQSHSDLFTHTVFIDELKLRSSPLEHLI
jgi:hypothetical protein